MDRVEKSRAGQARRGPVAARADGVFRPPRAQRQRGRRFRQVQGDARGKADATPEAEGHGWLLTQTSVDTAQMRCPCGRVGISLIASVGGCHLWSAVD